MKKRGLTETDFTRVGDIAFLFADGEPTAINLNHLVYAQVCGYGDDRHMCLTMSAIKASYRGETSAILTTKLKPKIFDEVIFAWQNEKEAAK